MSEPLNWEKTLGDYIQSSVNEVGEVRISLYEIGNFVADTLRERRDDIERAIIGGIRSAADAHSEGRPEWIGSAAKRATSQVLVQLGALNQ